MHKYPYILKGRSNETIEGMVREVQMLRGSNPKWTKTYNALARKYFKRIAELWTVLLNDVYQILDLPKQTIGKGFYLIDSNDLGCECCNTDGSLEISKQYYMTESEIDRVNMEFVRLFGSKMNNELDARMKRYFLEVMDSAKVKPGRGDGGVMQSMYFNTTVTAGNEAYEKIKQVYERQSPAIQREYPFTLSAEYFFDKDKRFVKEMYSNGYNLVSSAVTEKYLPGIKEVMKNALLKDQLNGLPLNKDQVARLLNERFGEAGLSHWQRLVRTEMASAIDKTNHDQMREAEVPYVRMSIGYGACEICSFYYAQNNGFYPIEEAPNIPEDTHPNCRCTFIPFYNLPVGPNENHELIPFSKENS